MIVETRKEEEKMDKKSNLESTNLIELLGEVMETQARVETLLDLPKLRGFLLKEVKNFNIEYLESYFDFIKDDIVRRISVDPKTGLREPTENNSELLEHWVDVDNIEYSIREVKNISQVESLAYLNGLNILEAHMKEYIKKWL